MSLTRTVIKLPLSAEQAGAAKHLMNMPGLCACGRLIKPMDAKWLLADVGPGDSPVPERRNTMTLVAYCYSCAEQINNTLKRIKDQAYKEKRPEWELRD